MSPPWRARLLAFIVVGCLLLPMAVVPSVALAQVRFVEMMVRTREAIESEADIEYLVAKARDTNIEGISVLVKDDETGELYYSGSSITSTRACVASALDYESLLKYLISTAHQHQIKVYAWLPMFKDPVLARERYDLAAMQRGDPSSPLLLSERFVSPFHPEVRAHEHKVITEALTKFEFDGVRLDFVRFDSDFADLSNYTRSLFKEKHGLDPATSLLHNTRLSPDWLKWVDFRSTYITTFLKEAVHSIRKINPQLDVGAYMLPFPASSDGYYGYTRTGNDYTHYAGNWIKIMPMVYWQHWATADSFMSWVNSTLFFANQLINAKVVPVFSVADQFSSQHWPRQPNDTMVDFYLSRAFDMASENNCSSVSLFYYSKWSDAEFDRVTISGDRSMGLSLWNGQQLTLTIFFFLLTTYSFYKIETFFLSLL